MPSNFAFSMNLLKGYSDLTSIIQVKQTTKKEQRLSSLTKTSHEKNSITDLELAAPGHGVVEVLLHPRVVQQLLDGDAFLRVDL